MTPEEEALLDEFLMAAYDAEFDLLVETYDEFEYNYDELKAKCSNAIEMIEECEALDITIPQELRAKLKELRYDDHE